MNLVIKSNAQGALEAVIYMLKQIPQKKVALQVLSAGVGEITETDVAFASTTKALILGFDTTFAPGAKQAANRLNVFAHEMHSTKDSNCWNKGAQQDEKLRKIKKRELDTEDLDREIHCGRKVSQKKEDFWMILCSDKNPLLACLLEISG